MNDPIDRYAVNGPFYSRTGHTLRYTVRRVINGQRMSVAAETKTLSAAVTHAKRLRTLDARTAPHRADWPITNY